LAVILAQVIINYYIIAFYEILRSETQRREI